MQWYNYDIKVIEEKIRSSILTGLTKEEAKKRLLKNGYNCLEKTKKDHLIFIFLRQFKDFMVIILLVSAIISGLIGHINDATIIMVIIVINAIIGVIQEYKAEKSIEALQKMAQPKAKVLRDKLIKQIPSSELVIGDIVILETGDYVPADIRLFEAVNLAVQEASFTGESLPIDKCSETINNRDLKIYEQKNMVFASSLITYGRGRGIVVATGMQTKIGEIANSLQDQKNHDTPLKKRLEHLGKVLGLGVLAICFIIFIIGIFKYHLNIFDIFLTAISLAVAAIPEGLPTVATIVLAIGIQRMAKKKAIVRRLPSIETLGSATVICSDKTGTLTQNKMTVTKIYCNQKLLALTDNIKLTKELRLLIKTSILCNDVNINYELKKIDILGDPTEVALVNMGLTVNMYKDQYDILNPRIKEIPFESTRKCMSTIHKNNNNYTIYSKGSFESILNRCNRIMIDNRIIYLDETIRHNLKHYNKLMAMEALRVLALAYNDFSMPPENINKLENNLIFIGMVGMIDPPREEVKNAIQKCHEAGIKTVMITGDHKLTAITIAKQLGILANDSQAITGDEIDLFNDDDFTARVEKYTVYARVSPEHKIKVIRALKAHNHIVAMTGDGINDAPALKGADIGIAMGLMGTDVAKEAADMILANDNFATIVEAVKDGRRIFANILKAIHFLISCNIGEILTVFIAMLIGLAEPLLPIHILWINLVTDCLPALALGVDPPGKNIMKQKPPKANANIFTPKLYFRMIYQGITIGIITLIAFKIGLQTNLNTARTMAFAVLGFSQLVHAFNIHLDRRSIFDDKLFNNFYLLIAVLISGLLMVSVLVVPHLLLIFKLAALTINNIGWIMLLSLMPIVVVELFKYFKLD